MKKAAALVKLLALTAGHALHREQVMETLWPGAGRKASANSLRQALHAARGTLHPDPSSSARLLVSSGERVLLCPEGNPWVDAEAFEEAAGGARRTREPAAYEAAIDLYAGELLPEDRYDEWAEGSRARLRGTYLSLLYELATVCEERGDLGSAEEAIGKLLAEEPTSEAAHASLMRIYSLGGRRGQALSQYDRLKSILSRYLGAEPAPWVRTLRGEISSGRYPSCEAPPDSPAESKENTPRHNIFKPRTSFVGREREILEAKRELSLAPLLTLTGAGGTGKTRLAMEVARDLAGVYPDGAWMVRLASLSHSKLVVQEMAGVLGVREIPGRPLHETLVQHLSDKDALLILDNCEHLLDACATLTDLLLDSCPYLNILATSRQPLGVEGEVVWQVPPLAAPRGFLPPEELAEYAGVRLFVERARLKLPAFTLTQENAHAVSDVCRGLEGMPLAVELAAARMGSLAAEHLAERLGDTLSLLSSGPRSASQRHRTMRKTLEWSYEPLPEKERTAFRRLSVFASGFTLEAAEAVLPGEGIAREEVLDLISVLADKSLLVAEVAPGTGIMDGDLAGTGISGGPRYRMLEPIRQYAREKLKEGGQARQAQNRHAAFFLALAEKAEPQLRGAQQAVWLKRLQGEHPELRAALGWVLQNRDGESALRLAGALGDFWCALGHITEGRRWLEGALSCGVAAPIAARIKALTQAGHLAWEQTDYDKASAVSQECLALARELGDWAASAASLYGLGAVAMFQKRLDEAAALFEKALTLWREQENTLEVARTLQGLGLVAVGRHEYGRAMEIHEESLELAREAEDPLSVILALGQGALAAVGRGEHELAAELCAEGLELVRTSVHPRATILVLNAGALLATERGQPVRAARIWGMVAALAQTIGLNELSPVEQYYYGPYMAAAQAALGEKAWAAAMAEGETMTLDEGIAYALCEQEPVTEPAAQTPSPGTQPARLTRREREVAHLLASGMTDRHIAEELKISRRTVATHVGRILKKLGIRTRAEVAGRIAGNH